MPARGLRFDASDRAVERGLYLHRSTYVGAGAEGVIGCAVFSDHTDGDFDQLIQVLGEG